MARIDIWRCKYQKKSSKYKYVSQWISGKGEIIWVAMICKTTKPFDTEREAAIYVDKALIGMGKEPVNIMVRRQV